MQFKYKASSVLGKIEEGIKEAENEQQLLASLQKEGLIPIRITPIRGRNSLFEFKFTQKVLNDKQMLSFTRELGTLLNSGLPLDRALSIIAEMSQNERFTLFSQEILHSIKSGKSLYDTLLPHEGLFGKFYLSMIRAGEKGGDLGKVLVRLSDYLVKSQKIKSTVSTALIYPALLFLMSAASLIVMMLFVVPEFKEMFDSAGKELPFLTQMVMDLADFMQMYWWLGVVSITILVVWFKTWTSNPQGLNTFHHQLLRLPVLGEILVILEITKITRTLSTLLSNGVTLLESLSILKGTIYNLEISAIFNSVEAGVRQGKSISSSLSQSPIFPAIALQLIKIGEETGKLEEMLLKVADIYDEQLKTSIDRVLIMLEPTLIISQGIIIGGIIVSLLLAILSVNDLII